MQPEEIKTEAQKIGEALGETEEAPMAQLVLMIETCGIEFVQKILDETEKIEEKGGIKTHNQKRRRTKGGVFFFVAKGRMESEQRKKVFPDFGKDSKEEVTPSGIEWAVRSTYLKPLVEEPGQVNNLTITLVGRPGKVHTEGGSVLTVIEQKEVKAPPYPKGVPSFEAVEETTYYYVFMSLKQWEKIEKPLEDETDMMIIEGTAVYDSELEGICILTTSTSTKVLERQKRLAQEANEKKPEKTEKAPKSNKQAKPDNNKKAQGKPAPKAQSQQPEKDLSNLPPSVSSKLQQLYSAADTLRQKIASLEEKGQKTGLNMTRRLLEQTEKQIATLEKQYDK